MESHFPGILDNELPITSRVTQHRFEDDSLNTPGRLQGRYIVRSPKELRPHPALVRLNLTASIFDHDSGSESNRLGVTEPILITPTGTIISGVSTWQAAIRQRYAALHCIEYFATDAEAIELILRHNHSRQSWNDFVRIRLALELEPSLQQKAIDNQVAGGKYKGRANLPNPEQIDVRRDIARIAGVGARNVSNVKTILQEAHPALIEALGSGTLRIHRALQWCRVPHARQIEQFEQYAVERRNKRSIRHAITSLTKQKVGPDTLTALRTLRNKEVREPGSVLMRSTRLQRTVILLGRDFFSSDVEDGLE